MLKSNVVKGSELSTDNALALAGLHVSPRDPKKFLARTHTLSLTETCIRAASILETHHDIQETYIIKIHLCKLHLPNR
jgi:hypothetical protein